MAALTAALRAENPDVIVGHRRGGRRRHPVRVPPRQLAAGQPRARRGRRPAADRGGRPRPRATSWPRPGSRSTTRRTRTSTPTRTTRSSAYAPSAPAPTWSPGTPRPGYAACSAPGSPPAPSTSRGTATPASTRTTRCPRIAAGRAELAACELPPFRAAIEAGVQSIMTGPPAGAGVRPGPAGHAEPRGADRPAPRRAGLSRAWSSPTASRCGRSSDRYGFEAATVCALAAGADAVCVGGDHADEQTAQRLRAAIVEAVVSGALPEERLAEAAGRVHRLAAWTARSRVPGATGRRGVERQRPRLGRRPGRRPPRRPGGGRSRRRSRRWPPRRTWWSSRPPATSRSARRRRGGWASRCPGCCRARPRYGWTPTRPPTWRAWTPPRWPPARAGRWWWWSATRTGTAGCPARVARVLAARPDAIVVEMGVPASAGGPVHLATYGATRANAQAAAELLAGDR